MARNRVEMDKMKARSRKCTSRAISWITIAYVRWPVSPVPPSYICATHSLLMKPNHTIPIRIDKTWQDHPPQGFLKSALPQGHSQRIEGRPTNNRGRCRINLRWELIVSLKQLALKLKSKRVIEKNHKAKRWIQGGAPPVMWTLVYKPQEYYSNKYHKH